MRMSAPVVLADRSLARKTVRSATSCGVVNRPVAAPALTDCTISSELAPLAAANWAATPPSASHRSVATGPGLMVLTRIPLGPNSFDSALA